jgi:superfamily II DNA or RNA helicase
LSSAVTSSAFRRGRSLPAWPAARLLRAWQQAAAAAVAACEADSFLASATPAAGKTTFGLHVAHEMLSAGRVQRVVVVAPTTHICRQWALDAARYGIDLEPNRLNAAGPEPRDRHGIAVTYATVAAGPATQRRATTRKPTLLIADEPHHMESSRRGAARRSPPSSPPASGCSSPARRFARTARPSRGSTTTKTGSRAPTTPTATRTRCSTACAGR